MTVRFRPRTICCFGLVFVSAFSIASSNAEIRGTWTDGDPDRSLADSHLLGAATMLPNGKVIAAGGVDLKTIGFPAVTTAELYDPATQRWSKTQPLNASRWSLDAITMTNGKALFAGGASAFSAAPALDSAEIYDPETEKFSYTANKMSIGRQSFGITVLNDGRLQLRSVGSANRCQ